MTTEQIVTKIDAEIDARRIAKDNGYAFFFETVEGWKAANRKPMLRFGKCFEVRIDDGEVYHA